MSGSNVYRVVPTHLLRALTRPVMMSVLEDEAVEIIPRCDTVKDRSAKRVQKSMSIWGLAVYYSQNRLVLKRSSLTRSCLRYEVSY